MTSPPVSVGTLPRTIGTWGAGDAPRLPIMDQHVFPIPLAMVFSTFNHALPVLDGECPCRCPAMEAQRSIFERASQAAAADWRRQPHQAGKSFSFAVCHQQDSHPGAHDADKLDANRTLFDACKTPFLLFHGASPFAPSPSPAHFFASPDTFPEAENEAFFIK